MVSLYFCIVHCCSENCSSSLIDFFSDIGSDSQFKIFFARFFSVLTLNTSDSGRTVHEENIDNETPTATQHIPEVPTTQTQSCASLPEYETNASAHYIQSAESFPTGSGYSTCGHIPL